MGLLKGESWEDYLNKECYVTEDNGTTGYRGIVRDYNESFILIEDTDKLLSWQVVEVLVKDLLLQTLWKVINSKSVMLMYGKRRL